MSDRPPRAPATSRDDRLKAALKANMARRKAQVRAREVNGQADDASGTSRGGEDAPQHPDRDTQD